MAADDTATRPAASVIKLRLRWLLIVVAVMAVLTAGWPLLNRAVANRRPLAAGAHLTVGTAPSSSAVITVGPGWSLLSAQSNPMLGYMLEHGPIQLSINHVALVAGDQVPDLWRGLRDILAVSDPGVRLSRPVLIVRDHRVRAITGAVIGTRLAGTATIVPGPSRKFGIEMIALAPRGTSAARRLLAIMVMRSLRFTARSP